MFSALLKPQYITSLMSPVEDPWLLNNFNNSQQPGRKQWRVSLWLTSVLLRQSWTLHYYFCLRRLYISEIIFPRWNGWECRRWQKMPRAVFSWKRGVEKKWQTLLKLSGKCPQLIEAPVYQNTVKLTLHFTLVLIQFNFIYTMLQGTLSRKVKIL